MNYSVFLVLCVSVFLQGEEYSESQRQEAIEKLKLFQPADFVTGRACELSNWDNDIRDSEIIQKALEKKEKKFKDEVLRRYLQRHNRYYFKWQIVGCVQAGANQNLIVDGICALEIDVNDLDYTQALLECKADPNVQTLDPVSREDTPILFEARSIEVAQLLIKYGASVDATSALRKQTVLHHLGFQPRRLDLLNLYLSHAKNVDVADSEGETPFAAFLLYANIERSSENLAVISEKIGLFLRHGASSEEALAHLNGCEDYNKRFPFMNRLVEGQIERQREITRLGNIEIE